MSAPTWDAGQGLSWSGKWHTIKAERSENRQALAYCGADVYRHGDTMLSGTFLQKIADGLAEAPQCKRCAAAVVVTGAQENQK